MSDRPSPWTTPAEHQGWSPAPSYAPAPAQPAYGPPYAPAPAPAPIEVRLSGTPSGGRGLAVAGVVAGGLALLVALGTLAVVLVMFLGPGGGGGGFGLRGSVVPQDGSVTGAALAEEVSSLIADDGGDAADVTCSSTIKVAQDVTAVCHGTDYGDPATFVVFFESDRGAFTLLEI